MNKIIKYFKNPSRFIWFLGARNIIPISDEYMLKVIYKCAFNKKLDLINPRTFNEKLQWLKLNDRKDIYTTMVDKYEVKKYVSDLIGEKYIIPTIGIYDKFNDINFDVLPSKFVIKCTHDSGGIVIVKDKKLLDKKKAKKKINKSLKRNYYYPSREWPYKNVKPRIIVEKYIENANEELIDYKFFCFNGVCKVVLVCSERFSSNNMCETWFDENWNFLDITESGHRTNINIKKPKNFELMKELCSKLSANISFLRVDFYEVNDKIYFGELTFYPASGYERFEPEYWNERLGDLIDLSGVKSGEN